MYEINKYNPLALVVNGVSGLVTGKDWERGNPISKGDALVNIASVVPLGRASSSTMIIVRDAKGVLKAVSASEAPDIWRMFQNQNARPPLNTSTSVSILEKTFEQTISNVPNQTGPLSTWGKIKQIIAIGAQWPF